MKTKAQISFSVLIWLFIAAGIQYSCSSSSPATNAAVPANNEDTYIPYNTLLQILRKEPQLNISGPESNPSIRIRGNKSILGNNEPLFVLNGVPLGYGYSSASSIDVHQVKSISVLPAARAGLYGSRGATGVIQITTK